MKLLMLITIAFTSLQTYAGVDMSLTATCVRADSGDSPEVKVFSNTDKSYGMIMLNTGAVEEFSHSKFFMEDTPIVVRDVVDVYTGIDISIALPTQLETTTESFSANLIIHKDTDNIVPWLQSNTNITDSKLGHEDVSIAMVCNQVN